MKKIGLLVVLGLLVLGCSSKNEVTKKVSKNKDKVFATEAFNMIQKDRSLIILDVRTSREIRKEGKIGNSQLIPLKVLGKNLNRLDKSKKILVYCRSGKRSTIATNMLKGEGYHAINMLGGIRAWKARGLQVE